LCYVVICKKQAITVSKILYLYTFTVAPTPLDFEAIGFSLLSIKPGHCRYLYMNDTISRKDCVNCVTCLQIQALVSVPFIGLAVYISSRYTMDKMKNKSELSKSNRKIAETESKLIPLTHIRDRSFSGIGSGTSIKHGGVRLVLWIQTSPLS
jgi:hypothetical protein